MIIYGSMALILEQDRILLATRACKPFKGYWSLTGGVKKQDETFEECLKREVMEELGLTINDLKLFGAIRQKTYRGVEFTLFFTCKADEYNVRINPDEVAKWQFFDINALPNRVYPAHRQIIKDYVNQ